jgi:hypothetical protein
MENFIRSYKNFTIKLVPHEEICSAYAADIIDTAGLVLLHTNRAGKTVEKAFEHGQRLIDFELEYSV